MDLAPPEAEFGLGSPSAAGGVTALPDGRTTSLKAHVQVDNGRGHEGGRGPIDAASSSTALERDLKVIHPRARLPRARGSAAAPMRGPWPTWKCAWAHTLFGTGIDSTSSQASLVGRVRGLSRPRDNAQHWRPCDDRQTDHLSTPRCATATVARRVHDQAEKMRIARQLERLRVDVIEAGFAASNGDPRPCAPSLASSRTAPSVPRPRQ